MQNYQCTVRPYCGVYETKGAEQMSNDVPKLFTGLPIVAAKEELQYVLNIGFRVIGEHKGEWSTADVEHLITDLNKLAMEKFYERSFIVRVEKGQSK